MNPSIGWQRRLISFAASVPYRDKGTIMMGFKDWLTQISGAICHAPTGRPREPPLSSAGLQVPLHPTLVPFPTPFVGRIPPPTLCYRSRGFFLLICPPDSIKFESQLWNWDPRARARSSTLSGPDKLSAPDDSFRLLRRTRNLIKFESNLGPKERIRRTCFALLIAWINFIFPK